jgi:hypothetical protein
MNPSTTELERAFQLAESGDCRSVEEIRKKLISEGYYAAQITGKTLLRQLQALISAELEARNLPRESSRESCSAARSRKDSPAESQGSLRQQQRG